MFPKNTDRSYTGHGPHLLTAALLMLVVLCHPGQAAADKVRVAVLKFGTVSWGLDVIKRHQLDRAEGFELEVQEFASNQATIVALQAGETDIAVSDWIWVARQRQEGRPFAFAPYSTATGAVMAPPDSGTVSLADLRGKRLGVAGGPLDKSWLLLRALSLKTLGKDLASEAEPVYGAPPLLNEQIQQGRLDAVLNYWHFAARLEAAGLTKVLEVTDVRKRLGIDSDVPMVGYVFDESWADAHRDTLLAFFRAATTAQARLADSDEEWEAIRPLMAAPDNATFDALRQGYRDGIPARWGAAEREDAGRLFAILREIGGSRLVGDADRLPEGTFWADLSY